jgi:hypothetical protein
VFGIVLVEHRRPAGFVDGLGKHAMIEIVFVEDWIRIETPDAVRPSLA